MPRKSSSRTKKPRSRRYRQNQNQQQNQQENELEFQSENQQQQQQNQEQYQLGGSSQGENASQTQTVVTKDALEQAGQIAQKLLNSALSSPQSGGSASSLQGADVAAADSAGLKAAIVNGAAVGAVAAAEGYTSLKGSPIVGGKRRKGKKTPQSQSQKQQQQQQQQNQKGGMVPGLLSAVETALVPLGLYLGQKALQSRRSGSRSLGKSFDFRRASRRTRRRR